MKSVSDYNNIKYRQSNFPLLRTISKLRVALQKFFAGPYRKHSESGFSLFFQSIRPDFFTVLKYGVCPFVLVKTNRLIV